MPHHAHTHISPSAHKMGLSTNQVKREKRSRCVQAPCVRHTEPAPGPTRVAWSGAKRTLRASPGTGGHLPARSTCFRHEAAESSSSKPISEKSLSKHMHTLFDEVLFQTALMSMFIMLFLAFTTTAPQSVLSGVFFSMKPFFQPVLFIILVQQPKIKKTNPA